jgi:AraC-like DNA-binding protein
MGPGEGLLGNQMSEVWLDGNEQLWVATSNGLFTAMRKDFDHWLASRQYKVMLYPVRKGSDLLTAREMSIMVENREISLSWNFTSQVLQAEPILVDFAPQQGRLYEYRVDGGEWQQIDNGEPIDVRHLLMGQHTLTVRLMGVEGTETTWQLLVKPSVWAWLELILFIVAIVSLWLWWRYRKYTKEVIAEHQLTEQALIEESEELREKYQKVKVDEAECEDIVKRMKEYLECERVYTNADLKMKDLADVLHLSAPKLSQIFNLYLGENYYDFINRYRLDEFKRLIEAGEYKRFTITALSEQCGFKKSNFFSTFRKVEGLTPAEYLKKRGIKV